MLFIPYRGKWISGDDLSMDMNALTGKLVNATIC